MKKGLSDGGEEEISLEVSNVVSKSPPKSPFYRKNMADEGGGEEGKRVRKEKQNRKGGKRKGGEGKRLTRV